MESLFFFFLQVIKSFSLSLILSNLFMMFLDCTFFFTLCSFFYVVFFLNFLFCIAAAKSLQSCPTLCDPTDGSPPGSPVPGILQARALEWVDISFSNAWKRKVKVKLLSRVRPSATPWTAAYQAPPSMGFSRQEYWSRVPLSSQFLQPQDEENYSWKGGIRWLVRVLWRWKWSRSVISNSLRLHGL